MAVTNWIASHPEMGVVSDASNPLGLREEDIADGEAEAGPAPESR